MLGEDDAVFKLTGPVLMKVEMADAKHNVSKRLEMIEAEIKRVDDKIAAVQGEQTALGDVVCNSFSIYFLRHYLLNMPFLIMYEYDRFQKCNKSCSKIRPQQLVN